MFTRFSSGAAVARAGSICDTGCIMVDTSPFPPACFVSFVALPPPHPVSSPTGFQHIFLLKSATFHCLQLRTPAMIAVTMFVSFNKSKGFVHNLHVCPIAWQVLKAATFTQSSASPGKCWKNRY